MPHHSCCGEEGRKASLSAAPSALHLTGLPLGRRGHKEAPTLPCLGTVQFRARRRTEQKGRGRESPGV